VALPLKIVCARTHEMPDLFYSAGSGGAFQELLAAGAATGRIPKAGDIKMMSVNQCFCAHL